jgi:flagellar basal-body rod protein FlgG
MDSGLFSAATGMMVKAIVHDVIGRNMANASTSGYKRERVIEGDFARYYNHAAGVDPELRRMNGSYFHDVTTDYSTGPMKETGNVLDMAINGTGFFTVQGPDNTTYYTRDGAFRINQNGELVTREGLRVIGEGGVPIIIPPEVGGNASLRGMLNIADDGTVYAFSGTPLNSTRIGKLAMVDFENPQSLEKLGAGFYANPQGRATEKTFAAKIEQGTLEMANFSVANEMVDMIRNERYFDIASRVVKTIDSSFGQLFQILA